jgi:hypothetical protein
MRKCGLFIVVLVMIVASVPAQAQDGGLTDEELALLDRVFNAREVILSYDSYVQVADGAEKHTRTFKLDGESQTFSKTYDWERASTVVRTDEVWTVRSNITSYVEETSPDGMMSYTLVAESRYVDETLYVNAEYDPPDPSLPALPDSWTVVDDLGSFEMFDCLQLEDILEPELLVDDPDLILATAVSVRTQADTLKDGTPVTLIVVTFDSAGLMTILSESTVPDIEPETIVFLLAALSTDSEMRLAYVMDAEDNLLGFKSLMSLYAFDVDAHAVAPDQFREGILVDLSVESTHTEFYRQLGEMFEPITAPEDVTQ